MKNNRKRIIGIDPGTAIVGYGILDIIGSSIEVIDYGCITTDKHLKMEDRLIQIYQELNAIIIDYKPDEMAVEELFYFKNNKTVISVGQARGVIILTGRLNNLKISSYTPLQVKIGICGYGRAEKKQIQQMVKRILNLKEIPKPDDVADALGIAITHINTIKNGIYNIEEKNMLRKKIETTKTRITLKEYKELIKNKNF